MAKEESELVEIVNLLNSIEVKVNRGEEKYKSHIEEKV